MVRFLVLAALAAAVLVALPRPAVADECWIHTPPGYQGIGGRSKIGPYRDWYEANGVNNQYFHGQGTIECTKTGGGGRSTPRFKYGMAHFHNRTSGTISMSVRTSPGGSWASRKIASGKSYYWWQECPCRFHAQWDGSFRSGYQKRMREVFWYGYQRKPGPSDGRDWQFVQRGNDIDLIEGSSAPIPRPKPRFKPVPIRPTRVTAMGRGTGVANKTSFRDSTSAKGSFSINFMPRVNGTIPTVDGTFDMRWVRILGNRNDPVRKEIWKISTTDMVGMGKQEQVIEFRMQGGAGTAEFWTTRVPGLPSAGRVKIRIQVQFSGRNLELRFSQA